MEQFQTDENGACEIGENILISMQERCKKIDCQMRFFEVASELTAKNFSTPKNWGVQCSMQRLWLSTKQQ